LTNFSQDSTQGGSQSCRPKGYDEKMIFSGEARGYGKKRTRNKKETVLCYFRGRKKKDSRGGENVEISPINKNYGAGVPSLSRYTKKPPL